MLPVAIVIVVAFGLTRSENAWEIFLNALVYGVTGSMVIGFGMALSGTPGRNIWGSQLGVQATDGK